MTTFVLLEKLRLLIRESGVFQWFVAVAASPSLSGGSAFFQEILRRFQALPLPRWLSSERAASLSRGLLVALVFAAVFVPRIFLGDIRLSRLDLRGEDLLLPFLMITTLASLARKKSSPELPAVERAFALFLIAAQFSILGGFFLKTIDKPLVSFFYLAKWVEYFLIFAMTVRLTRDRETFRFFLQSFFVLGIAVSLYGYGEHLFPLEKANYPSYYRLFERFPFYGNANHIGGLLVFWVLFFTGILIHSEKRSEKLFLFTCLVFVFFPLAWTFSRKSYIALGGGLGLLFFLRGGRKQTLFLLCLLAVLALFLPTRILERLTDLRETLTSTDPFHSSWAGNWVMWKEALWNFRKVFLLGSGLGSRHRLFYESQYVQVIAETGMVGSLAFLYLVITLFRQILAGFRSSLSRKERGIMLGWLLGFVGFLIHSLSCVSWTTTKTAIPFWFLSGAVLTHLSRSESARP